MPKHVFPCLRVLIGDSVSYFCNLTSSQIISLRKIASSNTRVAARTGYAVVKGGDDTDWAPVIVNPPVWSSVTPKQLELINSTLSLLTLGSAEVTILALPDWWKRGQDCVIQFTGDR